MDDLFSRFMKKLKTKENGLCLKDAKFVEKHHFIFPFQFFIGPLSGLLCIVGAKCAAQ